MQIRRSQNIRDYSASFSVCISELNPTDLNLAGGGLFAAEQLGHRFGG